MPALFRRREVWWPTRAGLALLLALAGLLAVAVGFGAYPLLAPQHPAQGRDGQGARTLVVEGWMPDPELQQAVAVIRAGHYERVLTTGGPLQASFDAHGWHTNAIRAANVLRAAGITAPPVIAVDSPDLTQDRTYGMARDVRSWAERAGTPLEAIDLFSVGVHTRRSGIVYRMALGQGVEVGTLAARPTEYDPQRWWTTSEGAKATLDELFGLAWTVCCFWP